MDKQTNGLMIKLESIERLRIPPNMINYKKHVWIERFIAANTVTNRAIDIEQMDQ